MSDNVFFAALQRWRLLATAASADVGRHSVRLAPNSRLCPPGFVGVVTIGDDVIVTVPSPKLLDPVRELVATTSTSDVVRVETWRSLAPDVVLGPARLAYALAGTVEPPTPGIQAIAPGSPPIMALLAGVPSDEADESGVEEITSPVFVELDSDGAVVAAAGWVEWPGHTAHVCVLVATSARGRGAAGRVGRAAVVHAGAAGMLVQWRARPGPSSAVARRIGMTDVGAQLSLRPTQVAGAEQTIPTR